MKQMIDNHAEIESLGKSVVGDKEGNVVFGHNVEIDGELKTNSSDKEILFIMNDENHTYGDMETIDELIDLIKSSKFVGINYYNDNVQTESFAIGRISSLSSEQIIINTSLSMYDNEQNEVTITQIILSQGQNEIEVAFNTIDGTFVLTKETADEMYIVKLY